VALASRGGTKASIGVASMTHTWCCFGEGEGEEREKKLKIPKKMKKKII